MQKQKKKTELSQASYDSLQAELQDLEQNQLPVVIERIAKAREQGDLSENSEYKDAMDQQELLEVRIGEIKDILAQAKIVSQSETTTAGVGIGSRVRLLGQNGKEVEYLIVAEYDKAAVEQDTLSVVSPMGKQLLGRHAGETVKVVVPAGEREFKIIKIT